MISPAIKLFTTTANPRLIPLPQPSSTINTMPTQQKIEAAQQCEREAAARMAIAIEWDSQEQQHVPH